MLLDVGVSQWWWLEVFQLLSGNSPTLLNPRTTSLSTHHAPMDCVERTKTNNSNNILQQHTTNKQRNDLQHIRLLLILSQTLECPTGLIRAFHQIDPVHKFREGLICLKRTCIAIMERYRPLYTTVPLG